MSAVENFKTDISNWFQKHGFGNLIVDFGEDFAYSLFENNQTGIVIGLQGYPEVGRYFEQFLQEYGLEYTGILDPVLALIHELGHSKTLKYFSGNELSLYALAKEFDHGETEQEWFNYYWMIPDEFAANIWEVNFINDNILAVEELCQIYINDWFLIFEETTIDKLLEEVA